MPSLWIDEKQVQVEPGATVLDAAIAAGVAIPTLCFHKGIEPCTSCFVCVVRINGAENFVPSCATRAAEGMHVESQSPEVLAARKAALELLLSDHVGDCMAPCQCGCPAGMDAPRMLRQLAAGDLAGAIATAKAAIPMPAVIGRICPAPCEKACRRNQHDGPLAIESLECVVGDAALSRKYVPACKPASGNHVVVVGAGPAGLAAAYHLQQAGHACTVLDDHAQAGGMMRCRLDERTLPHAVLDAEVASLAAMGVAFEYSRRVGADVTLAELRSKFEAVVLATGPLTPQDKAALGLSDLAIEKFAQAMVWGPQTSAEGTRLAPVFAAGGLVGKGGKVAVRAMAHARVVADAVDAFFRGQAVTPSKPFTCHIGHLHEGEMEKFLQTASPAARTKAADLQAGLTLPQAAAEAARCLHCDCHKAAAPSGRYACKLRQYAEEYGASATHYRNARRGFEQRLEHPQIIYESGKCIRCGLCIAIAQQEGEAVGLAFVGRGYDVTVEVPLGDSLAAGLKKSYARCAAACPTAALSLKD